MMAHLSVIDGAAFTWTADHHSAVNQHVEMNSTAIQQVASDTPASQQAVSGSTQSPQVIIIDHLFQ